VVTDLELIVLMIAGGSIQNLPVEDFWRIDLAVRPPSDRQRSSCR